MERTNSVRLVEEEKFGWTIVTSVHDGDDELDTSKDHLAGDALPFDESHCIGSMADNAQQLEQVLRVDDKHEVMEEKKENRKDVADESSESPPGEEEKDAEEELEDEKFVMSGGEDTKVYPRRGGFMWKPELREEACAEFIAKQTLAQNSAQKQGLMWRFSLVATLGFLGWVVVSGLTGGGKNLRSLKLNPCSIKEGDPVLTTL